MPTALITGSAGQDGRLLTEFLLAKGYQVRGFERDLTDADAVTEAVKETQPDECYHLGAQSFVPRTETPVVRANVEGTLHVMQAIAQHSPASRLFFAGSAEMFGNAESSPQDETTPMRPRSVYGVTKTAAYHLMRIYREQHNLFACCGILYNHESVYRRPEFVTRKITRAAARIRAGLERELLLGNLDTVRDWGHARDYVQAMWLMLQASEPDDYVVATGQGRTVRQFVEAAFNAVGLDWRPYVRSDPEFWRASEPVPLIGDASRIRTRLGWKPQRTFEQIVHEMADADLAEAEAAADLTANSETHH